MEIQSSTVAYARQQAKTWPKPSRRLLLITVILLLGAIFYSGLIYGPRTVEFDLNSGNYREIDHWFELPIWTSVYPSDAVALCGAVLPATTQPKWILVYAGYPMTHTSVVGGHIPIDLDNLGFLIELVEADDRFSAELKTLYFKLLRTTNGTYAGRAFLRECMSVTYTDDLAGSITRIKEVCDSYRKKYGI